MFEILSEISAVCGCIIVIALTVWILFFVLEKLEGK